MNDFTIKFKALCKSLNITYTNIELYHEAFCHPSYSHENNCTNYERLEYLGDSILGFLVAEYIFKNKNLDEGKMSKLRADYVCRDANAEYSQEMNLDSCLMVGRGASKQNEDKNDSVVANIFESFLGALYLDHDINYVRKILERFVFPKIDDESQNFFDDYKSKLQEYAQSERRQGVDYHLISSSGPAHNPTFKVEVVLDGIKYGEGSGRTKKEAEQKAAQNALEKLAR